MVSPEPSWPSPVPEHVCRIHNMATISDRDTVLNAMLDECAKGLAPEEWPEPLRQIFAQACWPHVISRTRWIPTLGVEHAKGLLLAGHFWRGATTYERLPGWVRLAAAKSRRIPDYETLAEHVRQHLLGALYNREQLTAEDSRG